MPVVTGDFDLTHDELRAVARFAAESAHEVLPLYEAACPEDGRPRAAIDAAWEFIDGARRISVKVSTEVYVASTAASVSGWSASHDDTTTGRRRVRSAGR